MLEIIREQDVATQEELVEELRSRGFDVTQATVSRDIRELRLAKAATSAGTYRYEAPAGPLATDALGRVQRAFREYVTGVTFSGHLIIVKTEPGGAQAVAAALDAAELPEVAGTVAGDDAVLVITKDGRTKPPPGAPTAVFQRFAGWLPEKS